MTDPRDCKDCGKHKLECECEHEHHMCDCAQCEPCTGDDWDEGGICDSWELCEPWDGQDETCEGCQ